MFEAQVCLKLFLTFLSAVSTVNLVEKTLQSLAPKPLRPPVTFSCSSLKLEEVSRWPKIMVGTNIFSSLCSTTGMPFPLFMMEMRFSSGLMSILIVSILGSRCLLSGVKRHLNKIPFNKFSHMSQNSKNYILKAPYFLD